MLSWFRRKREVKQEERPPAWMPPSDGSAPLPTLTNQLNIAKADIRALKKKYEKLDSTRLDIELERDNLHETLRLLCAQALKVTPKQSWGISWDGHTLPSRTHIHDLLIGRLARMAHENEHIENQLKTAKVQEASLRREVQTTLTQLHEAENQRIHFERQVVKALGEVGLVDDALELSQRKHEYLYEQLAKLSPHFKNLSAEKQAEKAQKDARKLAGAPPITPFKDPPKEPHTWERKSP